ncbi:MAG: LacI family DNA-binding transcriptional regulator [bacterium]
MTQESKSIENKGVTIRDIADRCGLGIATVSRALNDKGQVTPKTAAKVRKVAAELGYISTTNDAARRLVSKRYGQQLKSRLVAVMFPPSFQLATYFYMMYQGILDVMQAERYSVLTIPIPFPANNVTNDDAVRELSRHDVDGIIIPLGQESGKFIKHLQKTPGMAAKPIMTIVYETDDCLGVIPDEFQGGYLAAEHLIKLGHRHIIQFTHPGGSDGVYYPSNRIAGVVHALESHGINPSTNLTYMSTPLLWYHPIYTGETEEKQQELIHHDQYMQSQLLKLLKEKKEITGILAINDANAIRVRYLLKEIGLQVPDDISIVGCDDVDAMLDDQGRNMLTTIQMPLRAMGQEAARRILAKINDMPIEPEVLVLPPTLAIRGSTAEMRER